VANNRFDLWGSPSPALSRVRLPGSGISPSAAVLRRLGIALTILLVTVAVTWLGREGYSDNADGELSLLDAFYYATVSLSTTGYGDIAPVSNEARLVNVLVITPLRVLFLIVLVGTTLEALTERSRQARKVEGWSKRVDKHTVIVGFGTKGRSAARTLVVNGTEPGAIVVVDPVQDNIEEAIRLGIVGIVGDATRSDVLLRAHAERASHIVVATDRDDTSVLVTLTARSLNLTATIVAAAREAENAPLLEQSGANNVITSSDAAGRLLGLASARPAVGEVVRDLIVQGSGLDLGDRAPRADEIGGKPSNNGGLVIAVVRGGDAMLPTDPALGALRADDRIVVVTDAGRVTT
jgi:voltage-gated potassium channel